MTGDGDASPALTPPQGSQQHAGETGRHRWLSWALVIVAGLTLLTALLLAAIHVNDRYRLDHVSGARMALAQYFRDGILYPELFDGTFYGGTRWMPLPTILHGLLAEATGEYLVSGKLLSYASMGGLLVTMFWAMRRLRAPTPLALGLVVVPLATTVGWSALSDLRFDVIPVLFQLLAIETVARSPRPRADVAAAAFAALALISKVSAVWAPLAIVVWLLVRDRRRLIRFALVYAAFVLAAMLLFMILTEGRIWENVVGLSTAGIGGLRSLIVSPYRTLDLLVTNAGAAWALLPMSGLAYWIALKERRVSLYLLSLPFALVVLLLVMVDIGTGRNQLLDVTVLAALIGGLLAGWSSVGSARPGRVSGATVAIVLSLTVLWVDASGAAVTLAPDAVRGLTGEDSYRSDPLAGMVTTETRILSEDPYLPVQLGQRPVVLDPFMLLRIGRRDPAAERSLMERIEAREFEVIALVVPLEPVDQDWWQEYHFGSAIAAAIDESYEYEGRVQGYHIYRLRAVEGTG